MERLNIPPKIVAILKTFYINPRFRVKDLEGKSEYRRQNAGIRQGCPISLYLFIILMMMSAIGLKEEHARCNSYPSSWFIFLIHSLTLRFSYIEYSRYSLSSRNGANWRNFALTTKSGPSWASWGTCKMSKLEQPLKVYPSSSSGPTWTCASCTPTARNRPYASDVPRSWWGLKSTQRKAMRICVI